MRGASAALRFAISWFSVLKWGRRKELTRCLTSQQADESPQGSRKGLAVVLGRRRHRLLLGDSPPLEQLPEFRRNL